jgi:hypothetical protein
MGDDDTTDGSAGPTQTLPRGIRRRPYAVRARLAVVLSANGVMTICAGCGVVAGGAALAAPATAIYLVGFCLVPAAVFVILFSGRATVFEVSEFGVRFGAAGLPARLAARDLWSPRRGRPVIVRWQSIREIVISSGAATGDSRLRAEIGVMVNEGARVPHGWRDSEQAHPAPTECPYWQRFPPGQVDADELRAAIAEFGGGVEPAEAAAGPRPYHLYRVRPMIGAGVTVALLAVAAALVVGLVTDDRFAVLAGPLITTAVVGVGLGRYRRDQRLLSLDEGGLRFGRPIAFVPWAHVERVVIDGQGSAPTTMALRLGPESRLPRLYERRLPGADDVALATALSHWLPGRIRLIRTISR